MQSRDGQRSSDETAAVDLDEEDAARYRKLLADGIFTPEELARHYSLTDAELDALTNRLRPGTRAAIDAELGAIEQRLRKDRRGYFKDEAAQARYRVLLEQRASLAAKPKAEIEAERDDQGDAPGINPDLLAQWEKQGGIEANVRQVRAVVGAMLDPLEDDDADALEESSDALPQGAQTTIYSYLAVAGGAWPQADAAALQAFGETAEGGELIAEWGNKAARNVGAVRKRMALILDSMTDADRTKTQTWFDALPMAQAKAVMRALAGG